MKALLVVDVQNGLTRQKKIYKESLFLDTINTAIANYRTNKQLVVFIQHNNKFLIYGSQEWEVDARLDVKKEDYKVQKEVGNAFESANLISILQEHHIKEVLVCGLVSHACVKKTCLGGVQNQFEVALLSNGHSNWNRFAKRKIAVTEKELVQKGVEMLTL